jgi:hypothetical protein
MAVTLSAATLTRPTRAADHRWLRPGLAGVIWAVLLSLTGSAAADRLTIRRPGDHPAYLLEAEPHLNIGLIDPPGIGTGKGIGLGFRGTLELVDNGFVQTINNTVGLGVGIDYVHHGIDEARRTCLRTQPDPLDPQDEICLEFREGDSVDYLVIPVVMQWNFWLSEQWSVFGEPGGMLYLLDDGSDDTDLQVDVSAYAGGRWHFAEFGALTMRLGYPAFSVGVSFLL